MWVLQVWTAILKLAGHILPLRHLPSMWNMFSKVKFLSGITGKQDGFLPLWLNRRAYFGQVKYQLISSPQIIPVPYAEACVCYCTDQHISISPTSKGKGSCAKEQPSDWNCCPFLSKLSSRVNPAAVTTHTWWARQRSTFLTDIGNYTFLTWADWWKWLSTAEC